MIAALSPEARRWLLAGLVAGLYGLFCLAIAGREALRRRAARREAERFAAGTGAPILVAHASQTGLAEELALATARALTAGGAAVTLKPLADLTLSDLTGRALFLASTTGEGDAPDSARRFIRDLMGQSPDLSGLTYGLLALGDRSYADYCAFGRSLDAWLSGCGARPLFAPIEVDNGDAAALEAWRARVADLGGGASEPWARPAHGRWRLAERHLLNPGSPGEGAWRLRLEPLDGPVDWAAGDILEVTPGGDRPGDWTPTDRDYSIASLPADGAVELIVRLMRHPDGRPGLCSDWLTRAAPLGSEILARVRPNRAFHGPAPDRPMILIGNGTGLAGLRAHLKARQAADAHRNWLIFGERTIAHDYFLQAEIEAWRDAGHIARLDLAFSRDQAEKLYVQHRLLAAAETVRSWVAEGAAIYVCGSLQGMAGEVHAALATILDAEALERLTDEGRYRRDVY